jgi:CRISPR type IV-associated protein Csf3
MPNLQSGPTREYNLPFVQQLPDKLVAYAIGDRKRINDLFRRNLRYLGQKRHRGMGRIEDYTIEIVADDYSLVRDGLAMRWLPDRNGLREVRLRPPYWNNNGRVACCEIGGKYDTPVRQP